MNPRVLGMGHCDLRVLTAETLQASLPDTLTLDCCCGTWLQMNLFPHLGA